MYLITLFLKEKAATPVQTHCYFDPNMDFVLFFFVFASTFLVCWEIVVLTFSLQRRGLTWTEIAD